MQPSQSVLVAVRAAPPRGYASALRLQDGQSLLLQGHPQPFCFDFVLGPDTSQAELFYKVGRQAVQNCLQGFNSCLFCYGQTGSGKTHTMTGTSEDPGLVVRSMSHLLFLLGKEARPYSLKCSLFQIYNQQLFDLLDSAPKKLQIREDLRLGVFIENIAEQQVVNILQLETLLSSGSSRRHVAATDMNKGSSRSHSVFSAQLQVEHSAGRISQSKMHFVDLAGSERQKRTSAVGERLREAGSINKSLSTLGQVIRDLSQSKKKAFVSFRDSKLTFFLKDSLGGNSKSCMVATVSSDPLSFQETLCTLRFAERVKLVRQNAQVNILEGADDRSQLVQALRDENRILRAELVAASKDGVLQNGVLALEQVRLKLGETDPSTELAESAHLLLAQLMKLNEGRNPQLQNLHLLNRLKESEARLQAAQAQISSLRQKVHRSASERKCASQALSSKHEKEVYSSITQQMLDRLAGGTLRCQQAEAIIKQGEFSALKCQVQRLTTQRQQLAERLRNTQLDCGQLNDEILLLKERLQNQKAERVKLAGLLQLREQSFALKERELVRQSGEESAAKLLSARMEAQRLLVFNGQLERELRQRQAQLQSQESATQFYQGQFQVAQKRLLQIQRSYQNMQLELSFCKGELDQLQTVHEDLCRRTQLLGQTFGRQKAHFLDQIDLLTADRDRVKALSDQLQARQNRLKHSINQLTAQNYLWKSRCYERKAEVQRLSAPQCLRQECRTEKQKGASQVAELQDSLSRATEHLLGLQARADEAISYRRLVQALKEQLGRKKRDGPMEQCYYEQKQKGMEWQGRLAKLQTILQRAVSLLTGQEQVQPVDKLQSTVREIQLMRRIKLHL